MSKRLRPEYKSSEDGRAHRDLPTEDERRAVLPVRVFCLSLIFLFPISPASRRQISFFVFRFSLLQSVQVLELFLVRRLLVQSQKVLFVLPFCRPSSVLRNRCGKSVRRSRRFALWIQGRNSLC